MGPIYRDDKQIRIICREIMSLNLMPAEKITKRFESIVKEIDRWTAQTDTKLHENSLIMYIVHGLLARCGHHKFGVCS